MRLRLKERFICCLLAVTVLLTGICAAAKPTDSYFVRDSKASGYPCTFANPPSIADMETICEPVTLQKNQTIEIANGRKRLAERRCSDSFVLSGISIETLTHQMRLLAKTDDYCKNTASHIAIVRYIQRQDGKK